jgi:hypothetical protein
MANKKLQIEIDVNTSQVDQAVEKTGKLVDLGKGLKIQYDVDGKPLDVVIDKSINLQKQVRLLTAELRKTKEGTAEFKVLSTALSDTQDKLAQSNAKSRDLLGSLQLIPGPVGQIASQLNGAISLLKVFSSFSLKDLKFQLKETVNDFKDIYNGFLGLKDASDETETSINQTSTSLDRSTIAASKATEETKKQIDTKKGLVLVNGQLVERQQAYSNATNKANQNIANMTAAEVKLYMEQRKATISTQQQTTATTTLAAAEGTATTTTLTLTGAIAALRTGLIALATATGIGLVIVAIGALVSLLVDGFTALKDYATGAKEAAKDTALFAKELDKLNELLDLDLADAKRRNQERVAELKAAGKSEVDIRKETNKGLKEQLDLNGKAQVEAANLENSLFERSKKRGADITEDLKKIQKRRTELEQQGKDLRTQIRVSELDDITKNNKELDDRLMKDLDARIKLEIDKENTNKKDLEELLKEKLALRLKYEKLSQNEIKVILEENKKITKDALDADAKVQLDYIQKTEDIRIAAIQDEEQRQLEARANKRYFDIVALSSDLQFQKKSAEEQTAVIQNIITTADNDILKIKEQFFLKKYKQQQDAQILENQLYTTGAEVDLAVNQQRLDDGMKFSELYGKTIFGTAGLKKMLEERFIDLRSAYEAEYTANEEQFRRDEEALRLSLQNKKLTQENFDAEMLALGQKRSQNAQTLTARQIQLDKLEVDSKRASADATLQIGQNLAGLLGAIAGKNIKLQKAAAILDAGVSIARIITDTSRGIIAFSASVAPLGPAGVPIAAAYAVKSKISAALGIATIVASGIGKLKSIDENSLTAAASGGGETAKVPQPNYGRNYERGGLINGRRHAEGGALIEAEGGEAVMTRGAVNLFGPMLSMMNQAGGGTTFNSNLLTTRQDNPIVSNPSQEQAPLIVKTYVVSQELTTAQEKQGRLKNLSVL